MGKNDTPNLNQLWAAIRRDNWLVLDTETTGLHQGEIVQIAIVDRWGKTLLDTLVKPVGDIPEEATQIHGITNEMVKDAPTWDFLQLRVAALVSGKDLIVYNAKYDRKMMHQSAEAWGMPKTDWKVIANWVCAMEAYAEHHGEWNEYRGSYTWQSLTAAMKQTKLIVSNAHTALGDCLMTWDLVKYLADYDLPF